MKTVLAIAGKALGCRHGYYGGWEVVKLTLKHNSFGESRWAFYFPDLWFMDFKRCKTLFLDPSFQISMCWYKQDGGQPSVLKINVWSKGITKCVRAFFFLPSSSSSSTSSSSFFFFFLEGEFKECGAVSRGYEWKAFGNVRRNWAEGAASERNSPVAFGAMWGITRVLLITQRKGKMW